MQRTLVGLLVAVLSLAVMGQSPKDAYKALKKLQAQLKSGVTYGDFAEALVDAQLEVDLYAESSQAANDTELRDGLKRALDAYAMSKQLWSKKFEDIDDPELPHIIKQTKKICLEFNLTKNEEDFLLSKFPEIRDDATPSADTVEEDPCGQGYSTILRDLAMRALWKISSHALDSCKQRIVR